MKYLNVVLFFAFQFLQAQYTVEGTFVDTIPKIKNVGLYKIVNGDSEYLKYTAVKYRRFSFDMANLPPGYYRALYQNTSKGYVDFIYNKENVKFDVDGKVGQSSVLFLTSKENKLLQSYKYNIALLQIKLDSVQRAFLKKPTTSISGYQNIQKEIEAVQSQYENLATNSYCLSFIKASKKYNSLLPQKTSTDYINLVTQHFFEYVDFDNKKLLNSAFLKNKVIEYVFYLKRSDNFKTQQKLYVNAVKEVLLQTNNDVVKEFILSTLLKSFIARENAFLVDEVINYYKALPSKTQNVKTLENAVISSKTLIGAIAPEIIISNKERLLSLNSSNKYLLVFWSSSCSHCKEELPQVYKYLQNKSNITVVAVGLEGQDDRESWTKITKLYPTWKNVISIGKWESKLSIDYNISATPSYFILDKEKRIVEKPDSLEDLKTSKYLEN